MGYLEAISNAGLMPDLDAAIDEFLVDKSKLPELKGVIDIGGLKSEEVMIYISKGNRSGILRPGMYKKFVDLDVALARKTAAPIPIEQPVEEPTSYSAPMPVECAAQQQPEKNKGGRPPKRLADKVKFRRFRITPDTEYRGKVDTVKLDKVFRDHSMVYKILDTMRTPRTLLELESLAGERGYNKSRLYSTITVCRTKSSPKYLPKFGWEITEVGERDSMPIYQLVPFTSETD
jgi:hypothetical protein